MIAPFARNLFLGALLLLGLSQRVAASDTTDAIALASQQRMFAQQLVKAYCQMGLDIGYMDGQETTKKTLEQALPALEKLKGLAKGPEAAPLVTAMEKAWPELRAVASKPVDKGRAAHLHDASKPLIENATNLIQVLLQGSPSSEADVAVERMRFLTQRITSLYLLSHWGVEHAELDASYKEAMTRFDDGLIELSQLAQRAPSLGDAFKNLSRKWEMYKESTVKGQLPSLAIRMLESIMGQLDNMLKDPALNAPVAPAAAG